MQQRIENPAGVVGGEQGAEFDGDDDQPEDGGDPGLEYFVSIGPQAREPCPGCAVPDSRGRLSPQRRSPAGHRLLDTIVGGLAGDHYIVDVAFAESGAADAHEAGFLQEFGDGGAAAVAHAGFQSANHLVDDHGDGTAIRDASFNAFGNEFAEAVGFAVHRRDGGGGIAFSVLEITFAGTLCHGADGAHATIGLERAALIEDQFAGTFIGAGEKRTDHHRAGACGQGFGDVARVLDAAVSDDRNAGVFSGTVGFGDGSDLGHAGAGDYARGANGSGADTHLDAVSSGASQFAGAVESGDVAG